MNKYGSLDHHLVPRNQVSFHIRVCSFVSSKIDKINP